MPEQEWQTLADGYEHGLREVLFDGLLGLLSTWGEMLSGSVREQRKKGHVEPEIFFITHLWWQ